MSKTSTNVNLKLPSRIFERFIGSKRSTIIVVSVILFSIALYGTLTIKTTFEFSDMKNLDEKAFPFFQRRNRNLNILPRIIGGSNPREERYPYYVALYRDQDSFVCGGTLIASDVVATAAHCFDSDLNTVKVGKYLRRDSNNDDTEERNIQQIYVHPDFDNKRRQFDQMLIKLDSPSTFPYLKNINFDANIPSATDTNDNIVTVIGLGITSLEGTRPSTLQEVSANYIPNDTCITIEEKNIDYSTIIFEDNICVEAASGSGGPCYGDSGGAMLLQGEMADEDTLIGIVSWGVDCGMRELPSVGSRTSSSSFFRDTTCEIASDPPARLCTLVGGEEVDNSSEIPIPVVCKRIYEECSSVEDCCSGRCLNGVCRTSSKNDRKSLAENRGGAAGRANRSTRE